MGDWLRPRNDCQPNACFLKAGLDGPGSLGHVERHSPGLCRVVTVFLRALGRCGWRTGASCLVCHLARANSLVEEL